MRNTPSLLIVVLLLMGLPASVTTARELDRLALRGASVESRGKLQIIHLEGNPYDMGYQHGFLLQEEVKKNAGSILAYYGSRWKVPGIGRWVVNRQLDHAYRRIEPFLSHDHKEELRGLAEGSGVPLEDLQRVHAISERFPVSGSSFVVYGKATRGGRLLHAHNLDWDLRTGIGRHPVLFVCKPTGKLPFVNLGFAGFIGVFSGINHQGISVAGMDAASADETLRGIPMLFLLKQVLEESDTLQEAQALVGKAWRTGGYNYLFADAVRQDAVVLETTSQLLAVFYHEDRSPLPPYGVVLKEAMVRAETALDPLVRERQSCSNGNPGRSGLEPPAGSVYEERYRKQATFVRNNYGGMTPEAAQLIARESADSKNLQNVVYAYPEFWAAYAQEGMPASKTPAWHFHLEELF